MQPSLFRATWLAALAYLVAPGFLGQSSRTATPSAHQQKSQAASTQHQATPDQRGTEQSPVVVKVLPPPQTQEEAANVQAKEQADHEERASSKRWNVWTTLLLVGIAFGQLVVYGLQARRLRQTIEKMDEITRGQATDTKASIAEATRAATAMEQSAAAAKISANVAKDALTKLQRPFVSLDGLADHRRWDNLPDGHPTNVSYRVNAVLANRGTTPTKNMTLVVRYSLREQPLPPGFDFPYTGQPEPVVIGPQGLLNTPVGIITGDELLAVGKGERYYYLWGAATYRDICDDTPVHHFLFCYRLTNVLGDPTNPRTPKNPNGTDVSFMWFSHSEHNSAD